MQFTDEELKSILDSHIKWLEGETEGVKADLRKADLRKVNLRKVNLWEADLRKVNLCEADLRRVDLRKANLWEADLRGAGLCGADLRGANLRGADLLDADLRGAKLYGADLRGANLYGADLIEADLTEADLTEADLRGAKLFGADFLKADLRGAKLFGACFIDANLWEAEYDSAINRAIPLACPEDGSFIAWKKAVSLQIVKQVLIKLQIPEDAKRSSGTGRKCRASKCIVLDICALDNIDEKFQCAFSRFDSTFKYEVGKTVEVKDFDENRFNECAPGIHFFITKQEAIDY